MKASSSKSFPSNTEKNPKDCMAITLRIGKYVEHGRILGNSKDAVIGESESEKLVDENDANKRVEYENMEASGQEEEEEKRKSISTRKCLSS